MKVIQTIMFTGPRTNRNGGRVEPTDVTYYTGDNLAEAIVAMGQATLSTIDYYKVISVCIDMEA